MIRARLIGATAAVSLVAGLATHASAETITLRIASGHAPAVVYAGLMRDYFQPELKRRVEERTDYNINWVEGYGGAIVRVGERVLDGSVRRRMTKLRRQLLSP
jgi:hypothetical protein